MVGIYLVFDKNFNGHLDRHADVVLAWCCYFIRLCRGADVKQFCVWIFTIVFSSITWALGTILCTKKADRPAGQSYFSMGLQMLLSGSVLSLVLWMGGQFTTIDRDIGWGLGGIGYLTLFGSLVPVRLLLYALKHFAGRTSVYLCGCQSDRSLVHRSLYHGVRP